MDKNNIRVGVYTIRDALSGYMPSVLFTQQSDAVALRMFKSMAFAEQVNAVNEYPNDRYLVRLGYFDCSAGKLIPDIEEFGCASQFVKPGKKEVE